MELIEGIVLKQMNYKESSKIIYVYTPLGLVSVLVHGSNKLKSPYLNLVRVFSHVRLHVSGKNLKVLRDGQVIQHYQSISEDLNIYTYALHLMEVIYYFSTHEHDHDKLFHFLIKILNHLKEKDDFEIYIMMAELKLLYLLGVQPLLKHCVFCSSTEGLSFSVKDGGMVCLEHQQNKDFSSSTIHLFKVLYYYNLDEASPINYQQGDLIQLRRLIDEYYGYHLNYRSRSRQMVKQLLGY